MLRHANGPAFALPKIAARAAISMPVAPGGDVVALPCMPTGEWRSCDLAYYRGLRPQEILPLRYRLKMSGIDAARITAKVIQDQPVWDFSHEKSIPDSVRPGPPSGWAGHGHSAIALGVHGCGPEPASLRLFNVLQPAGFGCWIEFSFGHVCNGITLLNWEYGVARPRLELGGATDLRSALGSNPPRLVRGGTAGGHSGYPSPGDDSTLSSGACLASRLPPV